MAIPNSTWNELSTITGRFFVNKVADNVYGSNALYRILYGKKKQFDGGREIHCPVMYEKGRGGAIGELTRLDTGKREILGPAIYQPAHYYEPMAITRKEELENSGKAQLISLIRTRVEAAEMGFRDLLGTDLYAVGTVVDSIQPITGLAAMLPEETTPTNTYASIPSSHTNTDGNTWWQNQAKDASDGAPDIDVMIKLAGLCTIDEDRPDLMLTTQAIRDRVEILLGDDNRYVNTEVASAGFKTVQFHGSPLVVDSHCTAGNLYMLNTKYMNLYVHREENMRFDGWMKPHDQPGRVAYIFAFLQLACTNRRMHGIYFDIDAEAA